MMDNSDLVKSEADPVISGVEGTPAKNGAEVSDQTKGPPTGLDLDSRELPRLRQTSGRRPLFRS
jgi:hypothetical protein